MNPEMIDFFATKKRLMLLEAGLEPATVERIVDVDIAQIKLLYEKLKLELQAT